MPSPQLSRCAIATILMALLAITGLSQAKPAHLPDIEIRDTYLISPYFLDLSNTIEFNKTVYEDFTPINTTVTVNLAQDFRGKLVGQAVFRTSKTSQVQTFGVRGKLKVKKATRNAPEPTVTFKLKGLSLTSATIALNASAPIPPEIFMTHEAPEPETTGTTTYKSDDFVTTPTFIMDVKIRGTGRGYTYTQQVGVHGHHYIFFRAANDEEILGLKQKSTFDYYMLYAPFGQTIAQGSTYEVPVEGADPVIQFVLKASKFLAILTGENAGGIFESESLSAKLGHGKHSGPILPLQLEPGAE